MNNRISKTMRRPQAGFTLIELLVVVLIIGILAAIAVPQYFKVVEKGKFAEAMQFLSGLKGAQERYLVKNGSYFGGAVTSTVFDVNLGNMTKFTLGAITTDNTPSYSVTFTRNAPLPAVYGGYIITYQAPPGVITCNVPACTTDLVP
ncbi:MAG: prepilin-type N-terminal cleavage/methylation domain-containing protein [Elusimicrobiota bacterium]